MSPYQFEQSSLFALCELYISHCKEHLMTEACLVLLKIKLDFLIRRTGSKSELQD
jgi:hypothetical protein